MIEGKPIFEPETEDAKPDPDEVPIKDRRVYTQPYDLVKELGEIALDSLIAKGVPRTKLSSQFFYYISQDLLNEVQDTSAPDKIAEKVFAFIESDLTYWSKDGPFLQPIPTDRFNKGFASPGFMKIKRYFSRFGYTEYNRDLAARLQAKYQPIVNMVDHLVDTRNKIAHGDPTAAKTPAEVRDMVSIIRSFCGSTDTIFAAWWRTQFCPIRSVTNR